MMDNKRGQFIVTVMIVSGKTNDFSHWMMANQNLFNADHFLSPHGAQDV